VDTEQDEIMKTVEELGIDLIGHEALNLEFDHEEETEEEDYYGDGDEDFIDKDSFDEDSPEGFDDFDREESSVKKEVKPAAAKDTVLSDEDAISMMLSKSAEENDSDGDLKKPGKKVPGKAKTGKPDKAK